MQLGLPSNDVSKTFKRVNPRKAADPDGIPSRVLRACADQLAGVFMDIFNPSAFNTIAPCKLITKLGALGLNPSLCNWVLDFLTGRPQAVKVGNNTYATLILNIGDPRGRMLKDPLYSLFTHD